MNTPFRYDVGTGVTPYRKPFVMVRYFLALLVVFAAGLAGPRMLQRYGMFAPMPAKLSSSTGVNPVSLKQFTTAEVAVSDTKETVDPGLQAVIEQWAKRNASATWSVSVQRLGDQPTTATFNPNEKMEPASLYKLFLLKSLNEKVPFSKWSSKSVAGQSVKTCVDMMIRISDNDCAGAIGNMVGWGVIDQRIKDAGLKDSRIGSADNHFVTAADTAKVLALFNDGRWVESDAQNFILQSMKNQKYRKGIPAGVTGCDVFNKTGDIEGYKHDAAIVKCGDFTYTIVIMSKGGTDQQIASLAKVINNYLFSRR